MCGIVGILGDHEVGPLLVNALKRVEYRGYDSAGIATLNDGKLGRRRSLGKLAELSDLLVRDPLQGKSGIGHTRWATHGKPSVNNAHPHMTEQVAVVHNGIIENFQELRKYLEKKGILIRECTSFRFLNENWARISLQTRKNNKILCREIQNSFKK